MSIAANTTRRLTFVKHLYGVAVEQSHQPEPLAAVGLLTFHDSTELFLRLATEHLEVTSPQNFMDHWPILSGALPDGMDLKQREGMRRLNKARNGLKHHGLLPSTRDLETFRHTATEFFEQNTPLVFGIKFDELTLIDYVEPESAREELHAAEQALKKGELESAAEHTARAFFLLLHDYEERKQDPRHLESLFRIGNARRMIRLRETGGHGGRREHYLSRDFVRELNKNLDSFHRSLKSTQDALRILALGIDYRRYARFCFTTGIAYDMSFADAGRLRIDVSLPWKGEDPPPVEEIQVCIDFVVDTAIGLSSFDYTLQGDPWSRVRRVHTGRSNP